MSRLLNVLLVLSVFLLGRDVDARPRPLQPPGETADSFVTDEHGRRFRGAFTSHDRPWLGFGLRTGDDGSAGELSGGWRFSLRADFPDEEIWWQLRHEVIATRYRPGEGNLRIQLLTADYLRHDMSSWVLIPAKRDLRLPAPYDISLQYSLAGVEFEGERISRFDVGRLAFLADFVRDPQYRHRLAFGFEASYEATRQTGGWDHAVTPLSAVVGQWSWEERRGLFNVAIRPRLAREAHLRSSGPATWAWHSSVRVESEWVPIAVNDAPLSLVGAAGLGYLPGVAPQWDASVGLRVSWSTGP